MQNKYLCRSKMCNIEVAHPKFKKINTDEDMKLTLAEIGAPMVVKPINGLGSMFASVISSSERINLELIKKLRSLFAAVRYWREHLCVSKAWLDNGTSLMVCWNAVFHSRYDSYRLGNLQEKLPSSPYCCTISFMGKRPVNGRSKELSFPQPELSVYFLTRFFQNTEGKCWGTW